MISPARHRETFGIPSLGAEHGDHRYYVTIRHEKQRHRACTLHVGEFA